MTFISFIYKLPNDRNTYYGKYLTDYISDDHEGLDLEVKDSLLFGLNQYRIQNNLPELDDSHIKIGVLSFCLDNYMPSNSSDAEIDCFDFYCIYSEYNYKYYVDGILVE